MQGYVLPIPSGDAGIVSTLQRMRMMARSGALHPLVRQVAARLVRDVPGTSAMLHARLLGDWIGQRVRFLPDPTHAEALHDPAWAVKSILTTGQVQLDCDDVALLTAAMGLSIGLRARFVTVGFSSPKAPFRHVWTELGTGFAWRPVDPTRPMRPLAGLVVRRRLVTEV